MSRERMDAKQHLIILLCNQGQDSHSDTGSATTANRADGFSHPTDKVVPSSLSDNPPSLTMHQDLTTSSPAHSGGQQTQADNSKLQTKQSLP
ncbi:hypothetical protein SERLADRAFT_431656 [Serpula lacrymans var. lacrymans S7.9]|uniref:Uncharacterized protein n=1 Tax=Serpula lacrymans var. lacrymans (strain S7.9) TaxID=578457 RepID=F8NDA0_SERL9|nr:uncharacterized protein SERLADRAFT_431656 [Serpula lacrymans var. lacrymans S7.9]EGO30184.1 hypothetical protein SERLADRAFT_431656 [Serpula lacrymans var. lacrymans S7.9]